MADSYLNKIGLTYFWGKIKSLVSGKQDTLTPGVGIGISNNTINVNGIPYGEVDDSSTATAYTATVDGITALEDGVCMLLKNGRVTSASGFTININGLGAKPVYSNMATGNEVTPTNPTRDTTIFNINYTMLFVYSTTLVSGGAWICYRGYDANTNTIGYQLRTNSGNLTASDAGYRYRLWLTSADGQHWVPINTSTATDATTSRTLNTRKIDPFGAIVYNSTNGTVNSGARPPVATLWQQYTLTIGYSYVLSMAAWKPVYLRCAPQTDGSAVMEELTQTLPSTEDGKIYIFLGIAYSATAMELNAQHPVYYYAEGAIRLWTNAQSGSTVTADSALSSTSTNPVQNKVINTALANKVDKDVVSGDHSGTIANSGSSISLSYENSTAGQINEIVIRQTRAEVNVYNETSSAEASVSVYNSGSVILYASDGNNGAAYNFTEDSATIPNAHLTETPTAPTATAGTNTTQVATTAFVQTATSGKQDTLVSGTNIKTVNGNSLLGSGNLEIGGSGGVSVSSQIICLYSGGWSVTNEYRKSVSGVTPSSDVLVSYYPTSKGTYETISLYCKSQGEGVLTFAANTTPSSDIYVSILIIDGGEKITALLYNEEISGSAWWQENEPDGTEPNVIESANAGSTVYIFSMVQTITVNVTTVSGTTTVTLSDWGDDPDYGGYYTAFTIPQDAQICTLVL